MVRVGIHPILNHCATTQNQTGNAMFGSKTHTALVLLDRLLAAQTVHSEPWRRCHWMLH